MPSPVISTWPSKVTTPDGNCTRNPSSSIALICPRVTPVLRPTFSTITPLAGSATPHRAPAGYGRSNSIPASSTAVAASTRLDRPSWIGTT